MEWLIANACTELRVLWGHIGEVGGVLIFKKDNEAAITTLRHAVSQRLGGRTLMEATNIGKHQEWCDGGAGSVIR